jgi:ElaB/YqjD/DUF883 family membrane-anchored ribosome-binding protein
MEIPNEACQSWKNSFVEVKESFNAVMESCNSWNQQRIQEDQKKINDIMEMTTRMFQQNQLLGSEGLQIIKSEKEILTSLTHIQEKFQEMYQSDFMETRMENMVERVFPKCFEIINQKLVDPNNGVSSMEEINYKIEKVINKMTENIENVLNVQSRAIHQEAVNASHKAEGMMKVIERILASNQLEKSEWSEVMQRSKEVSLSMMDYSSKFENLFNNVTNMMLTQGRSNQEANENIQYRISEILKVSDHMLMERNKLNTVCGLILEKEKEVLKAFARIPNMLVENNRKSDLIIQELGITNRKALQIVEGIPLAILNAEQSIFNKISKKIIAQLTVHTDLISERIIPDLLRSFNEVNNSAMQTLIKPVIENLSESREHHEMLVKRMFGLTVDTIENHLIPSILEVTNRNSERMGQEMMVAQQSMVEKVVYPICKVLENSNTFIATIPQMITNSQQKTMEYAVGEFTKIIRDNKLANDVVGQMNDSMSVQREAIRKEFSSIGR